MPTSDNKRIAKNTAMLYVRMFFTMAVTLYTSRVVLRILGVEDFGIYNVVGGIVTMLAFLKGALTTSTIRFLTYELGRKDYERLQHVFSASMTILVAIGIIIFLLAETVGLWFLLNKMTIPESRMEAAVWTYQFSILTFLVAVTQVPYNAIIIAHEKMNIYAYVSIIEVILKLLIVYMLVMIDFDKLKSYAILMFVVYVIITLLYRIYCIRHYKESRFSFHWDKSLYITLANFSGWSLTGNFASVLLTQGSNILLNIFFGPVINASRAIAVQVDTAVSNFVTNFRKAAGPQIVKLYAAGEVKKMKRLILHTTKFSYFLLLILELPVLLETNLILNVWLGIVPDYAIIFIKLTLIYSLITVFDTSLYYVFNAMGRIKENAIISPFISFWVIPISYVLFKYGYSPVILFYVLIVKAVILSFIVKPILLYRYAGYKMKDIVEIFFPCIIVTLFSFIFPVLTIYYLEPGWTRIIIVGIISVLSVGISVLYFGIEKEMRRKVFIFTLSKIKR